MRLPHGLYQRPFHRLCPWPVAERVVRRRAEAAWRSDAGLRDDALEKMAFLVGASSRAAEVPSLAKEHVLTTFLRKERVWRPWLTTRQQVDNIETLRALAGRGAIVSFLHHGQYDAIFASINRYGVPLWVVVNGSPADTPGIRRHHANIVYGGARAVPNGGTFSRICELLQDGQIVAIAADVAGGSSAQLLGRRWSVRAGVARLAMATGAPVVPVLTERAGSLQKVHLGEPLNPRDYADADQILAAVFRAHEPALLAWPEVMGTQVLREMLTRVAPPSDEPVVPVPRDAPSLDQGTMATAAVARSSRRTPLDDDQPARD